MAFCKGINIKIRGINNRPRIDEDDFFASRREIFVKGGYEERDYFFERRKIFLEKINFCNKKKSEIFKI